MRRINKGPQPPGLQKYGSKQGKYLDMGQTLKDELRQALYDAQFGECAYCCAPLNPDEVIIDRRAGTRTVNKGNTRIEHFHPRAKRVVDKLACSSESGVPINGDPQVAWSNLLLCCAGDELNKPPSHCDASKQETDICGPFKNPSLVATGHDLLVTMRADGYLAVRPEVFVNCAGGHPAAQRVVDEVLNLNSTQLKQRRSTQVMALWKEYQRLARAKQSRAEAKRIVLNNLPQSPPFVQAVFSDWVNNGGSFA